MSQIPPGPIVVKLSADTGPLMAMIDNLAQLLVDAPDAFRERLSAAVDRFDDLVCFDNNCLPAPGTNIATITMHPSKILDLIVATARAGEFDLSVFDFLDHDSISVGMVRTSNEVRTPTESQGPVGVCPLRSQGDFDA